MKLQNSWLCGKIYRSDGNFVDKFAGFTNIMLCKCFTASLTFSQLQGRGCRF